MKQRKQALAKSLLALLCCLAMLVGTTFAWFTDSVVSGYNTIAAGNLDVELYHSNATVTNQKVTPSTMLFLDKNGDPILWEPGVVSYENLRVVNEGDLALIYQLAINTANENFILDNGAQYGLSQVLKVGVVKGGITATDRDDVIASVTTWTTLSAFLREGSLEANAEEIWGIVIYWQPSDNDNNWNANNGKQLSSGDVLSIDLGVKLTATQTRHEDDSFGNDYDVNAKDDIFPSFEGGTAGVPVTPDANGYTTEAVTITAGDITAFVPAGVKLGAGVNKLTLTINKLYSSESNVVLGDHEDMLSLDVHIEGVAEDNTAPITITLPEVAPKSLNMGNYNVYHVEKGATNEMTLVAADTDFTAHNQFKYDPTTGDIELYMATFSEVAVVAEFAKWEGNYDHSWYNAGATNLEIANADQLWSFSQIVGGMAEGIDRDNFAGKTVTLIANIDLNDMTDENGYTFYPIGYYNSTGSYNKFSGGSVSSSVASFEGTFDGNGHTIKNFYQNTWGMFGDYNNGYTGTPNHYKDAMGLFGYVLHGTVKNLTVENFKCDGEFAPTGVIAAFSEDSTFENIALVKCNPCVYNTGNGGIVGIGGDESDPEDYELTFNNITIDNTNKITALWGSWDVACGGLIGMFRGAGHVYMNNCHVGAQIDVYNDVCGNYQYYWYRYAGSLIGTNFNMTTDANGYTVPETHKYHATNCTVHFGDWNDYYYCELVANSLASYTHDHQMSRLTIISSLDEIKSGDTWTKTGNFLLFDGAQKKQDGEGTCYHIVKDANGNLVEHKHADAGTEVVGGETVLKEDHQRLYLPFNQLFTGYGWGVKHIPVGEFDGVRILDREEADSVTKFESYITDLLTNKTYKLGDLFSFVNNDVAVNSQTLLVSVTNLDANGNVKGVFTRNESNWKNSTLALTGSGKVQITIQDYYFCTATTITVNVKNSVPAPGISNSIVNGSFESSDISMWTKQVYSGNRVVTPIAARSGENGLSITGEGNWGGLLNQTFSVENGKDYVLVFWYKVNSQGFSWSLTGVNSTTVYKNSWVDASNTGWQKMAFPFTATNDSAVKLNFSSNNGNGIIEQFFLDDIFLVEKNLIFNNGFEFGDDSWKLSSNAELVYSGTHSGNYAVQINNPANAWVEDVTQTFAVERNQPYMVVFNSKLVSGAGRYYSVAYGVTQRANVKYLYNHEWFSSSSSWQEKMFIFDSGENDSIMLKFTAELANHTAGTIMIDDVKVYKINYNGILLDGDMETGLAYEWLGLSNNGNSYGLSTEEVRNGKYSMKATGNGSWGGIAWRYFTTEAGKSYTLTGWVKVTTGSVLIGVGDYTNLWQPTVIGNKLKYTADGTWQQVEFTFTATSNRSGFSIGGTGGSGNPDPSKVGVVYIDDLYLTPNP